MEFKPETAALSPKTTPFAGHRNFLTGKAAVDEVGIRTVANTCPVLSFWFSVGATPSSRHDSVPFDCRVAFTNVFDIVHLRDLGPVTVENRSSDTVDLDLQDRLDSGPVEA